MPPADYRDWYCQVVDQRSSKFKFQFGLWLTGAPKLLPFGKRFDPKLPIVTRLHQAPSESKQVPYHTMHRKKSSYHSPGQRPSKGCAIAPQILTNTLSRNQLSPDHS